MQNLDRYQRQYLFKPLGEDGQKKLCASRVVVIGCGALGSVIVSILARAGIGFLRIIDRDFIEINNLHRQILFDESDVREKLPKAIAAAKKIAVINSQVTVEPMVADVSFKNIESLIQDVDLVMDGTDNFETRFLLNDACVKLNKPWIYGACVGSQGLTMTIIPGETPCLKCVFEQAPPPELAPTCDTAGIIASASSVIASLECTEAIKLLSGNKSSLRKSLYSFNVWSQEAKTFNLGHFKSMDCPTCKKRQFTYLEGKQTSRTSILCGRNSVQISREDHKKMNFAEIAAKLEKIGKVSFNKYMLEVEIEKYNMTVFEDGRAIIKGTNDPVCARTFYSKYIGV